MTPEHQKQIDEINEHVRRYLVEGERESLEWLIETFQPFLKSQVTHYTRKYPNVLRRDEALQEAMCIFMDLTNEFTIGGTAYYNVYLQKKLPRRLWYKFHKEIKRRSRTLSHSSDQMENLTAYDGNTFDKSDRQRMVDLEALQEGDDFSDQIGEREERSKLVGELWDVINDDEVLTEREREMFIRSVIHGEEQASIAGDWGVKGSTVSRIITKATKKLQEIMCPIDI